MFVDTKIAVFHIIFIEEVVRSDIVDCHGRVSNLTYKKYIYLKLNYFT